MLCILDYLQFDHMGWMLVVVVVAAAAIVGVDVFRNWMVEVVVLVVLVSWFVLY